MQSILRTFYISFECIYISENISYKSVIFVSSLWSDRYVIFKLWKWLYHACFVIYMFTLQFDCLNYWMLMRRSILLLKY